MISKFLALHQRIIHVPRLALENHKLPDSIGHFARQTLLVDHFSSHLFPRFLVQLIHRTANGPKLLGGDTAQIQNGIQKSSMIEFDPKVTDGKRIQNFARHRQAFRIWHHPSVHPGNVEIALIKLPVPSPGQGRLIPPVDFADVIPFDISHGIDRQKPGEGNGQIVPQRQQFSSLIGQIVNQFGILSVLSGQRLLELKDGSVDFDGPVTFEDATDDLKGLVANIHLLR
mmetsp:Transcript_3033/g.6554  ORF Transcript_3033/g.6554 Transcript_3033/m.6554 type:complete len:228 (+) Transcript_3033:889-1572(+)